jgi:hypothetical protein
MLEACGPRCNATMVGAIYLALGSIVFYVGCGLTFM